MSESSGAGYLDRLLQGGAGAIQVESNGVALPAPVDKINLLGGSVVATYEPPAGGEKYGTAVVNLDDVTFTAGDPVAIVVGSAGDTGSGDSVALANHLHPCTRGTPSDIGTTNEAGTSADFAGADHIHALPFSAVHSALAGATGSVSLNGQVLTQIGAPTDPTAATNKAYVDASRQGLAPHPVIDGVLTANFALTGLDKTSSDGVVLSNPNMRVLATAQLTSTGNGLYLTGSGAWTLAADMAVGTSASGAYFMVRTVGTGWYCTNTSGLDVVGTNTLHFAQLSGATEVTVTAPLTKTGTEIDLSPATDSAAGSMSAADKTKLDAISGTAGKVAVFTSGGLGNSSITDNGSLVTVAEPVSVNAASATPALTINGTSGNTSIVLSDAGGSFYSSWDIHANSLSTTGGIRGALVFANQSDPTHPRFWMDYTGFTGWGGITDPSAYVDTPTLRVRTGAASGGSAQCDSLGNLSWTVETPGFGGWSATVSIGSSTDYALGSYAQTNAARANQVWEVELECEVLVRRASDPKVSGRLSRIMQFNIEYNSSGVPTTIAQIGDNNDATMAQANELGLPPFSDCYMATGGTTSVSVHVVKSAGGNAALGKSRIRVLSACRLDNW